MPMAVSINIIADEIYSVYIYSQVCLPFCFAVKEHVFQHERRC